MILLLRLLLSFCFVWDDISNTRDSVSSAIPTLRISSKILSCVSFCQLSSRCLDIPMKHCLSCDILRNNANSLRIPQNWFRTSRWPTPIWLSRRHVKMLYKPVYWPSYQNWYRTLKAFIRWTRPLGQLIVTAVWTTLDISNYIEREVTNLL